MKTASQTPARWAQELRLALRSGGPRFIEKVPGWRTPDLRRFARSAQRAILAGRGDQALLDVAENLFSGAHDQETIVAVLLLENRVRGYGHAEFARFDRWLSRVTTWGQHDALVHYLIGPLISAEPKRARSVLRWTRSPNRWRRRAAAVGLIQAARRRACFDSARHVTIALLADQDDMVQKGLGWLLREWGKADRRRTVPFLMTIRATVPRLVLRTACETLPRATRDSVLVTRH